MATLTMGKTLSDWVKYEIQNYSREQVVIAAGQNLTVGTVVGYNIETGKFEMLNPAATNGTQIAAGVLIDDVDATGGDRNAVIIARHAIVARYALVWPSNITEDQKEYAIEILETKGIIVRGG